MNIKRFLKFGHYTGKYPDLFFKKFQSFSKLPQDIKTVHLIIQKILNEFDPRKYYVTNTRNLKLSRFLSVSSIIKMRLRTCGSISAVCATILRKLGYHTKLVDGYIIERSQKRRHAWIEVYIQKEKKFIALDPFMYGYKVNSKAYRRNIYLDWYEMEKKK